MTAKFCVTSAEFYGSECISISYFDYYQTQKSFWESEVASEIPTLKSQFFDIIWGFPQLDFGAKKTKGQEIGQGWIAMPLALRRMILKEALQSIDE